MVFCSFCGSYTTIKLESLRDPCVGYRNTPAHGRRVLRQLEDNILPHGLSCWPEDITRFSIEELEAVKSVQGAVSSIRVAGLAVRQELDVQQCSSSVSEASIEELPEICVADSTDSDYL